VSVRTATVYLRSKRLILERVDVTTDGVPIGTDDLLVVPSDIPAAELGTQLLGIMKRARQSVPHPSQDQWDSLLRPLLDAAGVSSWRTFMNGARDLSVFDDNGVIELLPSTNLGPKGGFAVDEPGLRRVPKSDPTLLGHSVKAALNVSDAIDK
jgi:hypothetical protein